MTLTISTLERFKKKFYIGFDTGLNGLHFDAIGFSKVVQDKRCGQNTGKMRISEPCQTPIISTFTIRIEL
jgi:hypothetical protein